MFVVNDSHFAPFPTHTLFDIDENLLILKF